MRFILQYPEANGSAVGMLDAGAVPELAKTAEASGFHGIALTEHPAPSTTWLESGGHQSLDPFVALAAAAAVTEHLRLVTNLTVVPYRNPLVLAKSAATLDLVSGGRFVMGAGAGYLKSEYHAVGVSFDERNALFDEALQVMQLHWSGQAFDFEGRHFSARKIQALPAPVEHRVPIWMGGNSNAALRRAARYADGWMPMTAPASVAQTARTPPVTTNEELKERLAVLEALAGDRFEQLELVVAYSGPSLNHLDRDAEQIRHRLGELGQLGVDWVFVSPPWTPSPGPAEWVQGFGRTFLG